MFIDNQPENKIEEYILLLRISGSLSGLFSTSDIPYLYYRMSEYIFCQAFNTDDLSRFDASVDVKKESMGIGIKTFLSKSFQKIAEFNRDKNLYSILDPIELVKKVSELRNLRINNTKNIYGLTDCIYHYIFREKGKYKIFEEEMDEVNILKICNVKKIKNTIKFNDDKNEYSFLITKSTLTKRFNTASPIYSLDIKMMEKPLNILREFIKETFLDK